MGIVRSDYMIDEKTKSLLQIEMNTISTSFALIGCLMTGLFVFNWFCVLISTGHSEF